MNTEITRPWRGRETVILNSLSTALNHSRSPQEAYQAALADILPALDADAGAVLLSLGRGAATVQARQGATPEAEAALAALCAPEAPLLSCLEQELPLLMPDLQAEEKSQLPLETPGLRSLVAVPLVGLSRRWGVLVLASHHPAYFQPQDLDFLEAIGKHLGMALENIRLHQESQQRTAQIGAVQRIVGAISASLDVREVYNTFFAEVQRFIGFDRACLALYDEQQRLPVVVATAPPGKGLSIGTHLSAQDSPLGWVVQEQRVLLRRDLSQEQRFAADRVALEAGLRADLAVPLRCKGRVIGGIWLAERRPNAYSQADLEVLHQVAGPIALVIENARLYAAERRRAEQLAQINEVGRDILSLLDLDRLLDEVGQRVGEIFGCRRVALGLVEEGKLVWRGVEPTNDAQRVAIAASDRPATGQPDGSWPRREQDRPSTDARQATIRRVLAARETRAVPDSMGTELIIPLKAKDDTVVGVMDVFRPASPFDEGDRQLLESLAAQVAVTVDNVRLFRMTLDQGRLLDQRAARVTKILEVSQSLLRLSPQLEQLWQAIAHLGSSALEFEDLRVWRLDEEIGLLSPVTATDGVHPTPWSVVRAHLTPERKISRSYYVEQGTIADEGCRWCEGALLVPIETREGRVMGLLSLAASPEHSPSLETVQTLEIFANQVAIALENARLFAELERRLQETNVLFTVGQDMVTTLDLERVLESIVQAMLVVIPTAEKAVIHLVDESSQRLVPCAASHQPHQQGEPPPSMEMRVGEGIAGLAVQEKRPIYVADTARDPRFIGSDSRLRSLLVVPMLVGERVIGTLSVDSSQRTDAFTPADERLLTMLANQAAIAIENARLYAEARRADELVALNRLATALSSTLELDRILALAMEHINRTLGAEMGILFLLEETEDEEMVLVPRMALRRGQPVSLDFHLPPGQGLLSRVIWEEEPLLITNGAQISGCAELEALLGQSCRDMQGPICNVLCVPLVVRDQVIGAVMVLNQAEHRFTEDDLALLRSMAASVAMAIENARLYAEVRDFAEELAASQARLIQSEKLAATGKLAASIAHEINNPLQALQSCIYLVADSFPSDDPNKPYLDIAREELERIARIVERMVDLHRPPREGSGPTDVNRLVENVMALMRKRLQQGNITVHTELAPDLPIITATEDQLKQVFLNIILNAFEAMPQGGELTITTRYHPARRGDGWVTISFQDTGVGIPPEQLPRIFDPFFTTKSKGTGLGLSISYDIIERHGGRIEVESTVGQGTTFTVWLPVKQKAHREHRRAAPVPMGS